jgi:hypothetical protein
LQEELGIQERLKKFCVFCGKKPEAQSKEHVIPEWLIKLTGDLNRKITIGRRFYDDPSQVIKFSFNQLVFPACEKCNGDFSKLEDVAKGIIVSILSGGSLSAKSADLLLDWFDKVRTGLWLGQIYLHKLEHLTPHYYIKNRIGRSDRGLLIYQLEGAPKSFSAIGPEMPLFHHSPTSFSMVVNGYCFFNFSSECILSPKLGFPFLKDIKAVAPENHHQVIYKGNIFPGFGRSKQEATDMGFLPAKFEIYQPIFDRERYDLEEEEIESGAYSYFRYNCINLVRGKGRIFSKEGRSLRPFREDEFVPTRQHSPRPYMKLSELAAQTYEFQIFDAKKWWDSLDSLEKEKRRYVRKMANAQIQLNKRIIESVLNKVPQKHE